MAASVPPNPKLGKTQALNIAQATTTRLANLIPNIATDLSPVTVYQPAQGAFTFGATPGDPPVATDSYGVWVAPDVNGDGSVWYGIVECFGGGGGGGGGNSTQGGGGGGGAEYAREDQYPFIPGASYAYVVGIQGSGGFNNNPGAGGVGGEGTDGTTTVFDLAGVGLAGGVVANGGLGGDTTSVGIGGLGGTGSVNSVHFDGGAGGSNVSGNGSDNPVSLAGTSGMFVGNTLNTSIIPSWYIFNDSNFSSATRNDATLNGHTGTWTNFSGDFQTFELAPAAPAQVPAYTSDPGTYGPNQTTASWTSGFNPRSTSTPSARFNANVPGFSGNKLTVSFWVQAPSIGTWGNTPNGTKAIIASNSKNPGTNSLKGYAVYMLNTGSSASPVWQLHAEVGNGTSLTAVSCSAPATPGTWYYFVVTYNAGTLSLYKNAVFQQSAVSSGYTSVPGGGFNTFLGLDPSSSINWFFGILSNVWWATDCATTTLITQAFGLTPPTAGAGGGASGGPSANGGAGATGAGATGGVGGVPAVVPADLVQLTTQAMGGFAGANANSGNSSPLTPAGGPYGGGGGGSGDMVTPPTFTTFTYKFPAGATYAGVDASSNPASPYNTNQQNNPASGVNSLLYAGGLPADAGSGSKNSLMLLPKGIQGQIGSATYTITNVFLTVTNAFPANTIESILEVGYTSDKTLPQTYDGSSLIDYVAAIEIPPGAGTITYDLTQTGLAAELANGTATALMLGPSNNPTFDAYNAPTGPQFYASIYGPGAFDTTGNPLFPYLTVILQKTITTQMGSNGGAGAIVISSLNNEDTPVAFVEPFPGTDENGNQFAQGFTGTITQFDPDALTPGSYKPETWKSVTAPTGMTGTFRYKLLAESKLMLLNVVASITSTLGTTHSYSTAAIDSQYWPLTPQEGAASYNQPTTVAAPIRIQVTAAGVINVICQPFTSTGAACSVNINLLVPLD